MCKVITRYLYRIQANRCLDDSLKIRKALNGGDAASAGSYFNSFTSGQMGVLLHSCAGVSSAPV